MSPLKPMLAAGGQYHGVTVVKRLALDSTPLPAWASHPDKTLLVVCPRCEQEVRAHEGHVRNGTFRHKKAQCIAPFDVDESLEELEADGDLS